jgi:hypothetical protein
LHLSRYICSVWFFSDIQIAYISSLIQKKKKKKETNERNERNERNEEKKEKKREKKQGYSCCSAREAVMREEGSNEMREKRRETAGRNVGCWA